jgi:hypothetical protein
MYTSDADKIMRYTDEVRVGYPEPEMRKSSGMTDGFIHGAFQGRDGGTL